MKKRVLSLLLACAMLLTVPALAAADSMENFSRSRAYGGQFSDLTEDSVFYANVSSLYEYGLTVGKTDGTFGLRDSLTVGQVVIFAARLRSVYRTGSAEAGADACRSAGDSAVCAPYLRYLQQEGVLADEFDTQLSSAATRAQVAHVLARTLPEGVLPAVNDALVTQAYASRKYIADVTEYTDYYEDILALYRQGVCAGTDGRGAFLPGEPISRGAAAAMLTRLADPALRITLSWDLSTLYSAAGTSWGDVAGSGAAYLAAPANAEEVSQDVDWMLQSQSNILSLSYGKELSAAQVEQVMNQALSAVKEQCEQLYNAVSCTYNLSAGKIRLLFSSAGCTSEELSAFRTYTLEAAIAVHDQLWKDGVLRPDMTEYEKARVYFDWVCRHCTYDYGADDLSLSHTAYRLFKEGIAVCDGYTGAYNLLLKLEGIDCYALANNSHIWTVAVLDGTQYHIDTTWGDARDGTVDESYFGMTAQQAWNSHRW